MKKRVLFFLLFIALLLLPQLIRYTEELSQRLRSYLNVYLEEKTSFKISYNTVSLKLFNKLVLHDVQLRNGLTFIEISQLQVSYSLLALLNDRKNFWQLVSVENATIDIQFLDEESEKGQPPLSFEQFNLEVMIENSQLRWQNAHNSFYVAVDYFDFNYSSAHSTIDFQGTFSSEDNFLLQSQLTAQGIVQKERADFWLQTHQTQLSRFALQDMELFLQLDAEKILLYDLHSENNLNIDLLYTYEDKSFNFSASFQDLPLADFRQYLPFQPPTELAQQLFSGQLNVFQADNEPLSYNFDILAIVPGISEKEIEWSIKTHGQGDEQKVFFEELALQANPGLNLSFNGSVALDTLLPQGLFLFTWERQNIPYLSGKFQLKEQSNSIQIVSEDFRVEQDSNFALVAEMQRENKDALTILLQAFYEEGNFIDLAMKIQLVPEINFLLDFTLPEEGLAVKNFAHFLPLSWQEFFGDDFLTGETTWFIDRHSLDISWSNFQLKRDDGISLKAQLNWHSGQFRAENVELEIPDNPSGFNQLFAGRLAGSLQQGQLSGVFLGQYLTARWSYIQQKLYIDSNNALIEIGERFVKVALNRFLLPYQGSFVARMRGNFVFDIAEQWQLDFQNLELETLLRNRLLPQKIIAAGSLRARSLIVETLQWQQFNTAYTGRLNLQGTPFDYQLALELQSLKEEENLDLKLEYRNGEHYSGSSAFQIQLQKLFNNNDYQGLLHSNLEFDLHKTLFVKGETQLVNGLIRRKKSNFQTHWLYRHGDFLLRNFKGHYGKFQFNNATLLFNESKQKLVANATYETNLAANSLATTVNLDLSFIEPVSLLQLKKGFNRFRGQLDIAQLSLGEEELLPALRFIFRKNAANINVYETLYNSLQFVLEEGVLDLSIQQPFPFELSLRGSYRNNQLDANLSLFSPSILFFNNFIPRIYTQRIARIMQGEVNADLHIGGTLSEPLLLGDIQITNFLFQSPYLPETPQVSQLNFGLKDHVLLLKPGQLQFERGQLSFPGYEKNYFVFKNFELQRYFFEIKTSDLGIPVSYIKDQITSEGIILGSVVLRKQNEEQSINGNIIFRNLFITLESEERTGFSYTPPPPQSNSDLDIDLQITTGKNFIFERKPFLYAQGQANDVLRIYFNSKDNTGSIKGKLNFPSAELNLGYSSKGRGEVVFDEKLPLFNPLISFSSLEQVYQRGTPVAITLTYQGFLEEILDEENFPEISSDPEIPENEAKVLLLSKQTPFDENAWLLLPNFALQAGEDSLLRSLSTFLERNISFIDLLGIQTRIASNILLDAQLLTPISNPETRFLRYLDNSSLTLSKYIGRNNTVLLSAGFSMQYDADAPETDLNFSGLQIVPELGLTFITPLVTIGMELGLSNTQQLFIPESSIEVSLGLEL